MVVNDPRSYVYLLGLYLGDGHLNDTGRGWQLRIWLDLAYPEIVQDCATAMTLLTDGARRIGFRRREGWNAVGVDASWSRWPLLFPQYGRGRKHERAIRLEGWQQELVDAYPRELLRGLIHSDGCRTVNRFSTTLPSGRVAEYAYPRYFFTNMSPDIRALFCRTCEALGIRWTQSNHRNISVSHRRSVAALDAFIGPKA